MLLKLGNCLVDPLKVIWVEKRDNYNLFVSFDRDSSVCVVKANSKEQLDEFFDAIWNACAITYTEAVWTYKTPEVGENKNG